MQSVTRKRCGHALVVYAVCRKLFITSKLKSASVSKTLTWWLVNFGICGHLWN
jgi:hypothetical protein